MPALQGEASSDRQVIIAMPGWHDPWQFLGRAHLLSNQPRVITTQFAHQAILWALAQGRQPQ